MLLYSALSILLGMLNFLPLFLFFRRKIKKSLYFRLGHTETTHRLSAYPVIFRYAFPGLKKHLNPVWQMMNLLLPLAGGCGILCGILALCLTCNLVALAGIIISADVLALSLWLMLTEAMFYTLTRWKRLEFQKFSAALFFLIPLLVLCLKFFP